jgi:hypothetical protein
MAQTSLLNDLIFYANEIDSGRKGFATAGKEGKGRLSFEDGISGALTAFQQAQSTADPQTLIAAEYTFLQQELSFCH